MNPLILLLTTAAARAQEAAAPAGQAAQNAQPQGFNASFFIMLALIFGIFYFLLIRPQAKEQKEHQSLLASLKAGDRVVTASGLHGKVHLVKDDVVILEVADKVRVTVDKPSIRRRVAGGEG